MEDYNVYAVIDNNDLVVRVMDDFNDAVDYAKKSHCMCVETWLNNEELIDEYWIVTLWKQKIITLLVFFFLILTIPVLDGDATFAVFVTPILLYIFFSRRKWI